MHVHVCVGAYMAVDKVWPSEGGGGLTTRAKVVYRKRISAFA